MIQWFYFWRRNGRGSVSPTSSCLHVCCETCHVNCTSFSSGHPSWAEQQGSAVTTALWSHSPSVQQGRLPNSETAATTAALALPRVLDRTCHYSEQVLLCRSRGPEDKCSRLLCAVSPYSEHPVTGLRSEVVLLSKALKTIVQEIWT